MSDDSLPEHDEGHTWIEFRLGDSSLMIFKGDHDPVPTPAHVPWVYVDDVEQHFRRTAAAGATIIEALASPWGLPMYTAADPEGNHWTFAQARPTMR